MHRSQDVASKGLDRKTGGFSEAANWKYEQESARGPQSGCQSGQCNLAEATGFTWRTRSSVHCQMLNVAVAPVAKPSWAPRGRGPKASVPKGSCSPHMLSSHSSAFLPLPPLLSPFPTWHSKHEQAWSCWDPEDEREDGLSGKLDPKTETRPLWLTKLDCLMEARPRGKSPPATISQLPQQNHCTTDMPAISMALERCLTLQLVCAITGPRDLSRRGREVGKTQAPKNAVSFLALFLSVGRFSFSSLTSH